MAYMDRPFLRNILLIFLFFLVLLPRVVGGAGTLPDTLGPRLTQILSSYSAEEEKPYSTRQLRSLQVVAAREGLEFRADSGEFRLGALIKVRGRAALMRKGGMELRTAVGS
ncbi:MAG: hypothetical protein ABEI54_01205, partial [Candidatus Bipolaricaulia bacterium]